MQLMIEGEISWTFNRTSMELKRQGTKPQLGYIGALLIEPVWN